MQCAECLEIFAEIGNALNSPASTPELLGRVADSLVRQFRLKGCHFRLLSRDEKILAHAAASGLSERFLDKGPVDAEKSSREALAGAIVMVMDCANDPRVQYPEACAAEGIVSMLTIPLATRGQVIGVLRLSTAERREFNADELRILRVVSSFCTSAIIHAMFQGILDRVTDVIRTSLDLDAVLQSIVHVVNEDLRTFGCAIQLLDETGKALRVRAADGLGEGFLRALSVPRGEALERALAGETVVILRASEDQRVPDPAAARREGIGSMLFLPLMVRDRAIGVLTLCTHHPWQFSDGELYLLESVSDQCALAIRNAQMYASVKRRYENLTVDVQTWFEHYGSHPRQENGELR